MTQRASGHPRTTDLAGELEHGLSLPASWYTDPAIVELERERIFMRSWQYVGRTAQVTEVGDYFTAAVLDLPVVVVRGEQGLRAFVNVCRHRRHLVMSGAGHKKVMQCPYHAWTYGLDGCLRAAPARSARRVSTRGIPPSPSPARYLGSLGLRERGPGGGPSGQFPRPVAKHHCPERPRTQPASVLAPKTMGVRDANWKAMLENYLECYHCPTQHPGFSAIIDVDPDVFAAAS